MVVVSRRRRLKLLRTKMAPNQVQWSKVGGMAAVLMLMFFGFVVSRNNDMDDFLASGTREKLRKMKETVRVVCIGDTHGNHHKISVPDADVLLFTGDATNPHSPISNEEQLQDFDEWLGSLSHPFKYVIAGNHDPERGITLKSLKDLLFHAEVLQDEQAIIEIVSQKKVVRTLRIYGSPWQPQWKGDPVFETYMPEGEQLDKMWSKIPNSVDILGTHSPPYNHFDTNPEGEHIGSTSLLKHVSDRIKPLLHCFGHVHAGRTANMMHSQANNNGTTIFVNGAISNDDLVPVWEPVVIDV